MAARYQITNIDLKGSRVKIYASPKVGDALEELTGDMSMYHGVRLIQVLEAVYEQGKKDGAREAFERIDAGVKAAQKAIPHRAPGRPKKP